MLSLQVPSSASNLKTTPHIVPFRIGHTGPVAVPDRYWSPQEKEKDLVDGTKSAKVAYFRGRRLLGRGVPLQEGYRGVVVKLTDKTIEQQQSALERTRDAQAREEPDLAEDDGLPGESEDADDEAPVKVMEELATFDEVMVWEHEAMPAEDLPAMRGLQEWIGLAEAIHSYDRSGTL